MALDKGQNYSTHTDHSRADQTDNQPVEDIAMSYDMSPVSIMEINRRGGLDNTSAPVGMAPARGRGTTSGSRGTADAIASKALYKNNAMVGPIDEKQDRDI